MSDLQDFKFDNPESTEDGSGSLCAMCSESNEALSFCVICCVRLCERCNFFHETMKCFEFHHVITLKELKDTQQLTLATPKTVEPDNLQREFVEKCAYLKLMISKSSEFKNKLETLKRQQSESFIECNQQYAIVQRRLKDTRDRIIRLIDTKYTALCNSITSKITDIDACVNESLLKLMDMYSEMKNTGGSTLADYDIEFVKGYFRGLLESSANELPPGLPSFEEFNLIFCPGNLTTEFQNGRSGNTFLTPPFSDPEDQLAGEALISSVNKNVEPYKPLNIPPVAFKPTNLATNPDLSLTVSTPDCFPTSTNRVRSMQVYKTFGQKGNGPGQIHTPYGFCIGLDGDIIVADSGNHRIQIFDKEGTFKSYFGVAGRHDGYLWHPRKIELLPIQKYYAVCDRGYERSRMQFFSLEGKFIKKIDIHYIDIVAGIAVTADDKIVLVDSVTPTVFIIGYNDFLRSLDCKHFIKEPSDIAVFGKELYICDFKGHSIAVIDQNGVLLRKFGCQQTTIFPNGIDISLNGEVLTCDSHGNFFHVVAYSTRGTFITEFRSPYIKVSRCCGLKLSAGRLVTVDKNYHNVIIFNTKSSFY